jgi:hypothetical protein
MTVREDKVPQEKKDEQPSRLAVASEAVVATAACCALEICAPATADPANTVTSPVGKQEHVDLPGSHKECLDWFSCQLESGECKITAEDLQMFLARVN